MSLFTVFASFEWNDARMAVIRALTNGVMWDYSFFLCHVSSDFPFIAFGSVIHRQPRVIRTLRKL